MSLNINFDTYYKIPQCVITIHDSSAYYKLRYRVITIYDSPVITILDNGFSNLRQVLQFTTAQLLQFLRPILQFTTEHSRNIEQIHL